MKHLDLKNFIYHYIIRIAKQSHLLDYGDFYVDKCNSSDIPDTFKKELKKTPGIFESNAHAILIAMRLKKNDEGTAFKIDPAEAKSKFTRFLKVNFAFDSENLSFDDSSVAIVYLGGSESSDDKTADDVSNKKAFIVSCISFE